MIENPKVGVTYWFTPGNNAQRGPIEVVVKGFRLGWVETDGLRDGRHRSVARSRLSAVGEANPA